jgi:two-component system phosphate regulon sensor histidine kinase PhoR
MFIPKMAKQKHGTDKTSFGFFVQPELKNKNISVDKNKFSEIIENLVSNSIKYSPADRIALYLSAKTEENRIIINFNDKGIGIDSKDLPMIFKPFYQINVPGYGQDGLGLGLANVKMHVQAHNGNISVSSTLGEGTTFSLSFPFAQ